MYKIILEYIGEKNYSILKKSTMLKTTEYADKLILKIRNP